MKGLRLLTDRLGSARSKDHLNIRVRLGITAFKQGARNKGACTVIPSAIMKPTDSLHDLAPTTGHVENADGLLAEPASRLLQVEATEVDGVLLDPIGTTEGAELGSPNKEVEAREDEHNLTS